MEISSDLGGQEPLSGDPSELLGSLPADSLAAFAVSGFGSQTAGSSRQARQGGDSRRDPTGQTEERPEAGRHRSGSDRRFLATPGSLPRAATKATSPVPWADDRRRRSSSTCRSRWSGQRELTSFANDVERVIGFFWRLFRLNLPPQRLHLLAGQVVAGAPLTYRIEKVEVDHCLQIS